MTERLLHETKPDREILPFRTFGDDQLAPMQRIEGGGPPKPIVLHDMPRPLRALGYGLRLVLLLMPVIAIVASYLK